MLFVLALPTNAVECSFSDVPAGSWYTESTDYCFQHGLMFGTSLTTFDPYAEMSRGMLATVLYRSAGTPAIKGNLPFSDVPANKYYTEAVTWAYEQGIVNGITPIHFEPNSNITREQLVTIFYRYAQANGFRVDMEADLTGYTDCQLISSYALDAYHWAVAEGIMVGTSSTTLSPRGNVTRAQCAAVIARYVQWAAAQPKTEQTSGNYAAYYPPVMQSVYEYVHTIPEQTITRTGPGYDYDETESLRQDRCVLRTGIFNNGWSEVWYDGTQYYVQTKDLTGNENRAADTQLISEIRSRSGMMGRLTIPDVGVDVALFYCGIGMKLEIKQEIVDQEDCAVYLEGNAQFVLGDHNYQGFSAMKDAVPGETVATIRYGTYSEQFICIDRFTAVNERREGRQTVWDSDGNDIFDMNAHGMAMYTCNFTSRSVTVTYWQKTAN